MKLWQSGCSEALLSEMVAKMIGPQAVSALSKRVGKQRCSSDARSSPAEALDRFAVDPIEKA